MDRVVRVIDSAVDCPEIPLVDGKGNAKVVLWPGNGGEFRSIQLFTLEQGDRLIPLKHINDCVYYVIDGAGLVESLPHYESQPLAEGSIVHIDANDEYRILAGDAGIRFVGGPCPPDDALYENLSTIGRTLK